jgi:hypothetical protein
VTDSDAAAAAQALTIDPGRSNVVCAFGRKGSGKSVVLREYFNAWPYDRVVVDVTGDARPDDPDTIALTAPFPSQMPHPNDDRRARTTVWARIDPRSPTYESDQDDALALALYPRHNHALVWVDEYAELATANKIPRNTKLLLHSSRHYYTSALLACPRPKFIPRLTIQQADKVFIFELPDQADRETVCKNIGFPAPAFEAAYAQNRARGGHAYLLWDLQQSRLFDMPELPNVSASGPRA